MESPMERESEGFLTQFNGGARHTRPTSQRSRYTVCTHMITQRRKKNKMNIDVTMGGKLHGAHHESSTDSTNTRAGVWLRGNRNPKQGGRQTETKGGFIAGPVWERELLEARDGREEPGIACRGEEDTTKREHESKKKSLRMDTGTPAGTFGLTRTRICKNCTRVRVGSNTRTGYPRVFNAPAGPQTPLGIPAEFPASRTSYCPARCSKM
ncbi:hypothetical protein DFH09DRAFT_1073205 [Mycena vulgaris]|nr:hypothetical protein DFH09DRAFT_1073205 [Mycena vulgaris]